MAEVTRPWWKSFRKTDGVAIIYADLTPNAAREAEALRWLSDVEQTRRERFLQAAARSRYTLSRAALRAILCERLECDASELAIEPGEFGKPFALVRSGPAEISFNVSHSGRHGLIAVAREGRLGVDVEELVKPRGLDILIGATLTPGEQADLLTMKQTERTRDFFRLWTIKEALVKARGTGLSVDVSTFEVPAEMRQGTVSGVFRFPDSPAASWRVVDLGGRDFAAAVAYEVMPSEGSATEAAPGRCSPDCAGQARVE